METVPAVQKWTTADPLSAGEFTGAPESIDAEAQHGNAKQQCDKKLPAALGIGSQHFVKLIRLRKGPRGEYQKNQPNGLVPDDLGRAHHMRNHVLCELSSMVRIQMLSELADLTQVDHVLMLTPTEASSKLNPVGLTHLARPSARFRLSSRPLSEFFVFAVALIYLAFAPIPTIGTASRSPL